MVSIAIKTNASRKYLFAKDIRSLPDGVFDAASQLLYEQHDTVLLELHFPAHIADVEPS